MAFHHVHTFNYLYDVARRAKKDAEVSEVGQLANCLIARLFCAFTLEAYLNYVGGEVLPVWGLVQRPLRLKEKLDVICFQLHYTPDFGTRPFQSFGSLFKFRDQMVHGRSERLEYDDADRSYDKWSVPESEWQSQCTLSNAQRDVNDTRAMIESLNQALGPEKAIPIGLFGHGGSMAAVDEE